ncbi:hypothetical protein ACFFMP_03540 [Pseudoroseomonas cervicalis]|uniref:hypothetical protein n=1 Tax=Teichococcus cervicalis TaxID=204525 RepID=UPI0035EE0D8E
MTAAVVGVIANLALWFAIRLLFQERATTLLGPLRLELPVLSSLDGTALLLAALAAIGLFRFHLGIATLLGLAALAGLTLRGIGL